MTTADEFAQRLRAAGKRVTRPRLLVNEILEQSATHLTAEEVRRLAEQRGHRVTLPTVYATLNVLVEVDAARIAYLLPGSPLAYEARAESHHHLVCRDCRRVEDVDCAVGPAPCLDPADPQGFEVESAEVTYVGRCPRCAAR